MEEKPFLSVNRRLESMLIESLELENFRNYQNLIINFDAKTNILYGDNAQGKTNILEAIYLSGTAKSHKGSKDREMIQFHKEEAHIKLKVKKSELSYRIDIHLKKQKPKGIAINGIPIKKASELFGIVNLIFFSPEDLNLIKNGPAERRKFLDMELCQLNKIYVHYLVNYNKALMQRNQLLKNLETRPEFMETLDIWDMQLIQYGKKLMEQRTHFLKELNVIIYEIHKKLSGNREELHIRYEPDVSLDEFETAVKKARERDIRFRTTNVGPHRDDISFLIGDVDIRKFGSQGQQRTSALSLKLAEIEIVKQMIGDMPILLLDDVLSELDSHRQNQLLNSLDQIQTIITCTGLEEFIANRFEINRTYHIINGAIGGKT